MEGCRSMEGLANSRKLVVNVDDFGLHPAVSRFISRAIERSAITSASVLANGASLNDVRAMNNARELTKVGLGAHLNVLRGQPLSPFNEVRTLIGQNGAFRGSFVSLYFGLSS